MPMKRARSTQPSQPSPLRDALVIAGCYLAAALCFQLLAAYLAGELALSRQGLLALFAAKAGVFVLITTALLFVLCRYMLARARRNAALLLEEREVLSRFERRAAAASLSFGVVHDSRNLLQVLSGNLELLQAVVPATPASRRSLENMDSALQQLEHLMKRVNDVARGQADEPPAEEVEVAARLRRIAELLRHHPAVKACRLEVQAGEAGRLCVRPQALHDIVANLVVNAAEATGPGGRIALRCYQRDGHMVLEVADDGPGVPPEAEEAVFDAFVTTKAGGTGLGLLSVKMLAEEQDGRVEYGRSDLGGACFRVLLPRVVAAEASAAVPAEPLERPHSVGVGAAARRC